MSADLFALFGDAPEAADTQQTRQTQTQSKGLPNPSTAAAPVASDPFSFISSTASTLPSQNIQKNTSQWPPFQQTTTSQSESWLTSPVSPPPQINNAWGDIGSLGGPGGFQNQATTFPVFQEPVQAEEDDDGWGDFEVAPANPPPQPTVQTTSSNPPRAQVTRMSTLDIMSSKLVDLNLDSSAPEPFEQRASWESSGKTQQSQKAVRNPDPNVLFDADFEAGHGNEEDDDFGDFETGTPVTAIPPQTAPPTSALDLLSLDSDPVPATAVPAKKQPPGLTLSNTALQANPASYPEAPKSPYGSFQHRKPELVKQLQVKPPTLAKTAQEPSTASPSTTAAWSAVEDDDFGNNWEEFENRPDSKPTTAKPKSKSASKSKPTPKPPTELAVAPEWEWQDWGGPDDQPTPDTTATKTTTTTKAKPTTATKTTAKSKTTTKPSTTTPQPPLPLQDPLQNPLQNPLPDLLPDPPSSTTTNTTTVPPPTNIPPPSILLSLFPALLSLPTQTLLQPLSTLPPSSPAHTLILTSPTTLTFLKGYLALARVAARIITGRKMRWHRDRFLAQGMSVSMAPAGGKGQRGMKLAGVDKARAAHDEREAAEVVDVWRGVVGRVRGVVAGVVAAHANGDGGKDGGELVLRVPEVAVGLAVSTAKGVPTAPRACVVCGLKRDERVAKVDGEVEDSFGEWWVEFWGHRECRNFWVGHEKELRQR